MSIRLGAERGQRCTYSYYTELPLLHSTLAGWVDTLVSSLIFLTLIYDRISSPDAVLGVDVPGS